MGEGCVVKGNLPVDITGRSNDVPVPAIIKASAYVGNSAIYVIEDMRADAMRKIAAFELSIASAH